MGAKTPEIENCAAIESRYHPCRSTLTRTYLAITAPYSPHWHATITFGYRVPVYLATFTAWATLPYQPALLCCVGHHRLLSSAGKAPYPTVRRG